MDIGDSITTPGRAVYLGRKDKVMKKLKWYYKHGTKHEIFTVLYEDEDYILVQNDTTKHYSFGLTRDFGSLYGFPVNQSCLTLTDLKKQLNAFISIDKKYLPILGGFAKENIKRWRNMIKAVTV